MTIQIDESLLDQLVMPGDELLCLTDLDNNKPFEVSTEDADRAYEIMDGLSLGPGLQLTPDYRVIATQPGLLRHRVPDRYWVEAAVRRYVAARGEAVLGVVLRRQGDVYRVDIGSSETAVLSYLSFENATKRNRPDVQVGDVVYGRLAVAEPDLEPELVCVDGTGRSAGYGVLSRDSCALLLPCGIQLTRRLLKSKAKSKGLLQRLGQLLPHEVVVGHNGRIWLHTRSVRESVAVANALLVSETLTDAEIADMVRRLARGQTATS